MEIVKCTESFRGFLIYFRDGWAEMYGLDLKCMERVKCMERRTRCRILHLIVGRPAFEQLLRNLRKLRKQDHFPDFLNFLRVRGAEKAGRS
jgi:hypothetical protein